MTLLYYPRTERGGRRELYWPASTRTRTRTRTRTSTCTRQPPFWRDDGVLGRQCISFTITSYDTTRMRKIVALNMIMTLSYLDGWSQLVARTILYAKATRPSTFDRHED